MGQRRPKRSLMWCVPPAISLVVAAFVVQEPAFRWDIPSPFPRPTVPIDNPMSAAKVELGRRLFYDARLSVTRAQSCGSCHRQEFAFTDGAAQATGTTGEVHPRGSMSLANVAYNPALAWANPTMQSLEQQALVPMLGTNPVEMGMHGLEGRLIQELRADSIYRRLFPRAFPIGDSLFTISNVARAIASFERTMLSMRSPYDRYRFDGDTNAISASAKRGEAFFFSGQKGGCFQCHGGWNFSGAIRYEAGPAVPAAFFNTGLYNVSGEFSYPEPNTGLHEFTKRPGDVGKFRAPTLRNIAVTAPYMHDGSVATLADVLDHYAAGGRTIMSGTHAGVGRNNPNKAPNIRGFAMTAADKRDLIAFLETLTDSTFLRNRALSDPWIAPRR